MNDSNKLNKLKFIIFVGIIIISLLVIVINWRVIREIKVENLVDFIRDKGPYAVAIYLMIYTLKPILIFIPSNLLVIVSGILFGPIKGAILSMIGFGISASIAFVLARFLGKDFVQGILGNKLMKLDDNMRKDGFRILFLIRIIPIVPYDPLSYACGFTNIKFSSFLAASVIGVSIEILCYSFLGRNFRNPFSLEFLIPIIIIILITIFSRKITFKKENG